MIGVVLIRQDSQGCTEGLTHIFKDKLEIMRPV